MFAKLEPHATSAVKAIKDLRQEANALGHYGVLYCSSLTTTVVGPWRVNCENSVVWKMCSTFAFHTRNMSWKPRQIAFGEFFKSVHWCHSSLVCLNGQWDRCFKGDHIHNNSTPCPHVVPGKTYIPRHWNNTPKQEFVYGQKVCALEAYWSWKPLWDILETYLK